MTREVLQLALEALEFGGWNATGKAIAAIKAALAQPVQPAPPSECKTEAEKIAYAFGWFKSLESVRPVQPAEPVKGKNYEQGLWSVRNYEAMIEDGNAQPVQPKETI